MRSKTWTLTARAIAYGASVRHVQRMLGRKGRLSMQSLFEDDLDDMSDRLDAALVEAAAACVA